MKVEQWLEDYSKRGEKPIIDKPVRQFRCNMVCAVSNQDKLISKIFQGSFNIKVFIGFLGMMISKVRKKIFLIVDNHPVHRSNYLKLKVRSRPTSGTLEDLVNNVQYCLTELENDSEKVKSFFKEDEVKYAS